MEGLQGGNDEMNRTKFTDISGKPCMPYIRLTATTEEERQILKDLVVSRVRWLECDFDKGFMDLVDELVMSE